jgi:hypothetical protein
MLVEVALDDDGMLDVGSLEDGNDADVDLDDEFFLIVEDGDVLSFVDDEAELEEDFDVEYLLELGTDVAIFVVVDDIDALDLAGDDEGLGVELGTDLEIDSLLVPQIDRSFLWLISDHHAVPSRCSIRIVLKDRQTSLMQTAGRLRCRLRQVVKSRMDLPLQSYEKHTAMLA